MKRYTVNGKGLAGLQLEETHPPGPPGSGEVCVDVRAVSLNYRDLMVADGRYGGEQNPAIVACSDMAGVVVEVGPDVTDVEPGDRVLNAPFRCWPAGTMNAKWEKTFVGGNGVDGVLAQQIIYPADALVSVPDHFTFREGSTLTIAGLTAWAAVVTHGKARPGDWVLVHGTGGVSIFALQIARLVGARTILSTAHEAKAERAKREFGVTEVIDYRQHGWPQRVAEITSGCGVDVVVEVAGGRSLGPSIQSCAYGGRVSLVGVLDGMESTINVRDLLRRQVTVRGILMESTEELRAVAHAYDVAKIRPHISRVFSFDQTAKAYEYLQSQQHIGKVVIDLMEGDETNTSLK
ncbi:MAG TPA: NAD(P)-dependent alcohol dehydrogenase [Nitrospirales bacterium]|nr:NAD(P)-dependent alcohol dehydrogenase [Nitrospirales bacterium]